MVTKSTLSIRCDKLHTKIESYTVTKIIKIVLSCKTIDQINCVVNWLFENEYIDLVIQKAVLPVALTYRVQLMNKLQGKD